ncbi:MAG: hypothetical protein JWM36_2 [Hyphomicrobiales bacterium]|nr:hypothetical protein [Hyphomicrobiales bacterium]
MPDVLPDILAVDLNAELQVAGDAKPPALHKAAFVGDAREYYSIWVVTVFFNIVTLGVYSAWGKVRRQRYFLGNTYLDGHNFEYHANPVSVLKGRLLVVAIFLAYKATIFVVPQLLVFLAIYVFVWPWLVLKSLCFNARMTSYRNLRFGFAGSYWRALKVMVLFPAASFLSLGLLAPFAARARWRFLADGLTYGGRPFAVNMPVSRLYSLFGGTAVIAVGGLILLFMGTISFSKAFLVGGGLAPVLTFYVIGYLVLAFYRAGLRNIALRNLHYANDVRFASDLSRMVVVYILFTNLLATVISLGLLRPWAAIRSWKYTTENTAMIGEPDFEMPSMSDADAPSAFASEQADIGGFDIGF